VLAGASCVTVVADRESDIYEQYARRPEATHLLTRAAQDRCLADAGRLFATVDAWVERHHDTIDLPATSGRPARKARVALRFDAVSANDSGQEPGSECRPVGGRCRRSRRAP
jgi:hypothetical protein